ncbi:MAG: hypothetical protein KF764_09170 [Labilithrix sp.]|nr:hypothetical protein [Labilithrix sp.]
MVTSFAILAACGGATAPAIGEGNGNGASSGDGSGGGGGSGSAPGDGTTADAGSRPIDAGPPGPPPGGDSDPGLIACGGASCKAGTELSTPGAEYCCVEVTSGGLSSSCKLATVSSCGGHRLSCDEAADCGNARVCCAERQRGQGSGERIVTGCRPTCITGAPRVQVCKTDDECENGAPCKAYDCGGRFPTLRFCEAPAENCN